MRIEKKIERWWGRVRYKEKQKKGMTIRGTCRSKKKIFFCLYLVKKKRTKNWRGKSPVGRTKKDEKKIRNFRDLKSKKRKWRRRLSNENWKCGEETSEDEKIKEKKTGWGPSNKSGGHEKNKKKNFLLVWDFADGWRYRLIETDNQWRHWTH